LIECPNCHATYETAVAFCGDCGNRFSEGGAAAAADPLIGIVVDSRYRIIDLVGRGGMGAVYRVEHVKMGKVMAMKLLHGELSQNQEVARRFRREAEAVSRLSHINTVSVFDFGTHQGMMYLVMEYIEGRDLSDVLRAQGSLPATRVAPILVQVCSALVEAHGKGIIHRDIKPENILVSQQYDRRDFVKVLDFGLAKLREQRERTKITQDGSLVGTPYYMAPEHIRGEGVDSRSDVYSLGAVMYKLLTGETPFSASSPMGIITKHLTEKVDPPSMRFPNLEIPTQCDAIVIKAMNKKPDDRYGSAYELRSALADLAIELDPNAEVQRFTSTGDLGGPADPQEAMTPAVSFEMPTQARPETPVAAPPRLGPNTITIGAREVGLGTKSEFIKFERGMKVKRGVTIGVLALVVVVALLVGAYFILIHGRDDSSPTFETEPNDTPAEADSLTAGVQLAATIAGASEKGDIDWYRVKAPGRQRGGEVAPWAVGVQVSGVPGLDMALQLVDPNVVDPLARGDREEAGGGEFVAPTAVTQPDVYLMVQEVRLPGVPPGNFATASYGVTATYYDAVYIEKEPNDAMAQATAARVGVPISAVLSDLDPTDWYCLPAGTSVNTVSYTSSADVQIDIALKLGAGEAVRKVRPQLNPQGGYFVRIPSGPGPVCVKIDSAAQFHHGKTIKPLDAPYQIVFQ
jgi:serine/threonine-protein kinase